MSGELVEERALTGLRPTGGLHIGNLIAAIQPMVSMQETFGGEISAFVADVHGLTTEEPADVVATREDTARSWLAAGVDPSVTSLYVQSDIESQVLGLDRILQRHTTVARLSLMPSAKDDLEAGHPVNQAKFGYPTLMAADIIGQDASRVPVGEDQLAHLELTRDLARGFNRLYGGGQEILVVPEMIAMNAVRILSLNGRGKMSKSSPSKANVIFLHDDRDTVANKIRRAQAAAPGEMTAGLESLFVVGEAFSTIDAERDELRRLRAAHEGGERVMSEFKPLLTDLTNARLGIFQERYADLTEQEVRRVLLEGGEIARDRSQAVLDRAREAMGFPRFSGGSN